VITVSLTGKPPEPGGINRPALISRLIREGMPGLDKFMRAEEPRMLAIKPA
jgi:hypothetical protein